MIVLRLTIGDESHVIRSDKLELVLGSDPLADVTFQSVGWAPRQVVLRQDGTGVVVEGVRSKQTKRLEVGQELRIGSARLKLAEVAPPVAAGPALVFGGYENDAPVEAAFELSDGAPNEPRGPLEPTGAEALASQRTTAATKPTPSPAADAEETTASPPPSDKKSLPLGLFKQNEFGHELVLALKQTPFYGISIAIHVLLFFMLSLISTEAGRRDRTDEGLLRAALDVPTETLGAEQPRENLPESMMPHFEPPELPDAPDPIENEERTPDTPEARPSPLPVLDDGARVDVTPVEVGLAPRNPSMRTRASRDSTVVPKEALNQRFAKGLAGAANKRAAEVVRDMLGRGSGRRGDTLDKLKAGDILVVHGAFDHIDKVLDILKLPYTKKSVHQLLEGRGVDFNKYKFLFWNCGEAMPPRVMRRLTGKVAKFVRNGGYLFSTDWSLANVVVHAFPGYLKTRGAAAPLPEMVVDIEPSAGQRSHPLLDGVFLRGSSGKWWLEQSSYDCIVANKDRVEVLIESKMLADPFNRSPAVAVTFHEGRGRVLHVMGHYYQEEGNLAGAIAAQRLALNFVLMRLQQDAR